MTRGDADAQPRPSALPAQPSSPQQSPPPAPGLTSTTVPMPVAPLPASPPTPLRVEIAFEYTFDELREGLTLSPDAMPTTPARTVASALGLVVLVALFVCAVLQLKHGGGRAAPTPVPVLVPVGPNEPPSRVEFMIAVAPALLAAGFVAIAILTAAAGVWVMTARSERVRRSHKYIGVISAIAFVLLLYLGVSVLSDTPEQIGWTLSRAQAMTLALVPWLLVAVGGICLALWLSRSHLRRQWESKPYLRRRRAVVLDDRGEHSRDETTDLSYRWPHFRRAWETDKSLVLLDENDFRHILPKRAMDRPTLDRARSIISSHVADCRFHVAPGGFPVQQRHRTSEDEEMVWE